MPHYAEVVRFVWNHRYATTGQIANRFAARMPSPRTAQYQLAALVELGYLATAPVRSTSPNFPNVYYVTAQGIRFLRATGQLEGDAGIRDSESPRSGGAALQSMLHEILLTEFDEAARVAIDRREDLERLFVERRFFRRDQRLTYEDFGRVRHVVPDSGFLLRMSGPNGEQRRNALLNLVELDNGSASLAQLRNKLRRYDQWSTSPEAGEYLRRTHQKHGVSVKSANFRLLLIARSAGARGEDEARLIDQLSICLELSRPMRERIWLTTVTELRRNDSDGTPLDRPVWYRVRDCRRWLGEYRQFVADLPLGRGHKQRRPKQDFIAKQLGHMRRHTLFPQPE